MTLDEKLTLLHGAQDPSEQAGAGYVPGIERLGIPELRLADGPAGIRTSEPATALPAPSRSRPLSIRTSRASSAK